MLGKIESLQREYDFVSRLSTDEVAYIIEKKKEAAATRIQRVFRKRAAENKRQELRKLMIASGGLGAGAEDKELLASLIPPETVEQRKQELKKLRERTEEKYGGVMRFYDQPIPEERKKELRDMVTNKRRLVSQIELEKRYKDLDLM